MNIFVAGDFENEDGPSRERLAAFCTAIGKAVSKHGHVLLNGNRNECDRLVAQAAYDDMQARGDADATSRVISYVLAGREAVHDYGTVIRSRLTDWDLKGESFLHPRTSAACARSDPDLRG